MPKKITEDKTNRFFSFWGFVSVYREELDEIINLWKAHGNISIQSGGYEFENLDDLNKYFGNNTPDLSISVEAKEEDVFDQGYSVGVDFKKRSSVILSSFREEGRLYLETKEILSKNHSSIKYIFDPLHILYVFVFFGQFSLYNYLSDQDFPAHIYFSYLITFFVFFGLLGAYIFSFRTKSHWRIDLNTKHAPNFFQRHKDNIIWALISGFLVWASPKIFNKIIQLFN